MTNKHYLIDDWPKYDFSVLDKYGDLQRKWAEEGFPLPVPDEIVKLVAQMFCTTTARATEMVLKSLRNRQKIQ